MSVEMTFADGVLALALPAAGVVRWIEPSLFRRLCRVAGAPLLGDLADRAVASPGETQELTVSHTRLPYPQSRAIAEGLSIVPAQEGSCTMDRKW